MTQIKDKYDKAIEYLTKHPDKILDAWANAHDPKEPQASCLFHGCGVWIDKSIGCLTMIRGNPMYRAETPELTQEIRNDDRIPDVSTRITVKSLPVFAEWQRKLDKVLKCRQLPS